MNVIYAYIENARNANGLNDNYKKHLKTTFICEYFLVTCYYYFFSVGKLQNLVLFLHNLQAY